MGVGPYGCSYAPVFLNLIRLANPLLKYANVCGPPVENQCTRLFDFPIFFFGDRIFMIIMIAYHWEILLVNNGKFVGKTGERKIQKCFTFCAVSETAIPVSSPNFQQKLCSQRKGITVKCIRIEHDNVRLERWIIAIQNQLFEPSLHFDTPSPTPKRV